MSSPRRGITLDLTKEQAVRLYRTRWWKRRTPTEIVSVQLFTVRCIMPFGDFRAALDSVMGGISEAELMLGLPGIKERFLTGTTTKENAG